MTEIRDDSISIALDAMGGDSAPDAVIEGANLVLSGVVPCDGKVHFSIYGKKEEVLPVLAKYKLVEANSVFVDVSDAVSSSDRPSYALRHRRRSSMWHAVEDLKKGLVSAVVSAGNTGALMAISRHLLGTIHSIDRPAIAVAMPSQKSSFVVLDIGANIECSADALLQFAIMGVAFAKAILGRTDPKVGLLNVGSEEVKGTYAVQEAFSLMRAAKSKMDFYGYIEAEEVFKGEVDVVVADGFSGNIMLKTTEAVANLLMSLFKDVVKSSITAKIAACMLKPSVRKTMELVDPKLYNGAMLVGLNGVVVKSHGSADGKAYACAIKTAVHSARYAIVSKIASEISEMG
ncbi:phosphate acyltransferase PlsX [Anaplasma phagocytophilum]|uniref:Phosphate acyltransferase n=2 Tax=Anaplasma phagocytophilum TaxID=948 RepID=A0A168H6N6_ANAPH|nr:phosphate acyltransferase PlsX [Anaplasma phagocytophilum]ANC34060.1 phosphate acyltransferase [Anaplasma phagocytophilum str. Norway variant2]KJV67572.1 fatty acid/phospholipid synthesis protein PlsX [Anaplasma phagocytophilum str. ApNP]